jgi:hypothetical protein
LNPNLWKAFLAAIGTVSKTGVSNAISARAIAGSMKASAAYASGTPGNWGRLRVPIRSEDDAAMLRIAAVS